MDIEYVKYAMGNFVVNLGCYYIPHLLASQFGPSVGGSRG